MNEKLKYNKRINNCRCEQCSFISQKNCLNKNNVEERIISNHGITLISLVVTIIILIILAGVAVNLSLGENGIFRRAKQTRDKYLTAEEREQRELNELYKQLGIENLPENTKENPQEIGKEVSLKDGWGKEKETYTNTKNGQEVKNLIKVATVYAVSVGNGDTVPVPKGFYYVGGTLDDGVIISDSPDDAYEKGKDKTTYEYTTNLKGNQFVWIPCSTSEYKKCNVWNGTTQTNSTLGNAWWDKTTPKSELTQIEKYGGFYVARYEAGLAETISEFTTNQKSSNTQNQIYNKEGIPQSKAGVVPWMCIDWDNSKKNAESMYNNNYVSSGLITGTQWDVILNKMVSKKAINASDLTNSNNWGNYRNTTLSYNGRLAIADYNKTNSNAWTLKPFEAITTGITSNYSSDRTYGDLLTTGASDQTEKYHIFDIAGNLWEITEEISFLGGNTTTLYHVLRGGSFSNNSTTNPTCFRDFIKAGETAFNVGYRVILYIK